MALPYPSKNLPDPSHDQIMKPGQEGTCEHPLEGSNPSTYPTSVTLPDKGDTRNKSGGSNSDPCPAMPGAK